MVKLSGLKSCRASEAQDTHLHGQVTSLGFVHLRFGSPLPTIATLLKRVWETGGSFSGCQSYCSSE